MRKKKLFSVVRVFTLGIVLTSLLLAAGCRGENLEEQIAELTGHQALLEYERDSIRRVLALRDRNLEELETARGVLDREVETLTGRTVSLSATAASRGEQLRDCQCGEGRSRQGPGAGG
jgi:hypothetical protein